MNELVSLSIRKVLLVRSPVVLAFDYFTRDIGQWWPMSTHSYGKSSAATCRLECIPGGRIYEIGVDDDIHLWGQLTEWRPPFHLRFAWAPDQADDIGTDVQIEFSENGRERTRVELLHEGWRPHQMKHYVDYRRDWDVVLINGYQDYVQRRRL